MHPQWSEFAARLKEVRARLAACHMLRRGTLRVAAAGASGLGLDALLCDHENFVRLGVFDLPSIPVDIMAGPEGACRRPA